MNASSLRVRTHLTELAALLTAGLGLGEALATLIAKERVPARRELLTAILRAVSEGRSFSDVLAMHPQEFSVVLVATVRAAERTGELPAALERYIAYEQQFEEIRARIVSAAIYPAMLLLVGTLVTLFLLGYVVPKFAAAYDTAGRDLPWLSARMLEAGRFIHGYAGAVVGAFALALGSLVYAIRRSGGVGMLAAGALRIPVISDRARDFRLARFYRGTSLLLNAGIPLPRALPMVGGLLDPSQQERLALARRDIDTGKTLSVALSAHGLVTPVAESLIRVGERAGNLADMLERATRFHDDEFGRWVSNASRLLEPLLMTAIGLVIGTVVVLMYIPIFELAGSLQ